MNIFVLDKDPVQAAKWHCDAHVIKMILETAQMLSTVHQRYVRNENFYRPTHRSHPCTLWAGKTAENYHWLWTLGIALTQEYQIRYGKTHKTKEMLLRLKAPPGFLQSGELTDFALCMPDKYKTNDPVESYRLFYKAEKNRGRLGTWKQNKPEWF
jgi:hypothetical protein